MVSTLVGIPVGGTDGSAVNRTDNLSGIVEGIVRSVVVEQQLGVVTVRRDLPLAGMLDILIQGGLMRLEERIAGIVVETIFQGTGHAGFPLRRDDHGRNALLSRNDTFLVVGDIPPDTAVDGVLTAADVLLDDLGVILGVQLTVVTAVEGETIREVRIALLGGLGTDIHLRDVETAPVGPGLDTVGEIAGDPALDGNLLQTVGSVVSDGRAGDVSVSAGSAPLLEGGLDTGLIEGLGIGGDPSAIGGLSLGEEDAGGGDHGQGSVHGDHLAVDGGAAVNPVVDGGVGLQAERNAIEGRVLVAREDLGVTRALVAFDVEVLEHAGILEFLHLVHDVHVRSHAETGTGIGRVAPVVHHVPVQVIVLVEETVFHGRHAAVGISLGEAGLAGAGVHVAELDGREHADGSVELLPLGDVTAEAGVSRGVQGTGRVELGISLGQGLVDEIVNLLLGVVLRLPVVLGGTLEGLVDDDRTVDVGKGHEVEAHQGLRGRDLVGRRTEGRHVRLILLLRIFVPFDDVVEVLQRLQIHRVAAAVVGGGTQRTVLVVLALGEITVPLLLPRVVGVGRVTRDEIVEIPLGLRQHVGRIRRGGGVRALVDVTEIVDLGATDQQSGHHGRGQKGIYLFHIHSPKLI